jgi:small conductance mechanosensitive channel
MNGDVFPVDRDVGQILRDFEDIEFRYILVILVMAWVLIKILKHLLPWLTDRVPARFRFYILPLVPVLRLVILFGAVILIVPELIEPKLENFVAIVGALGLAIGFAFKDYVSSLAAGIVAVYEHPYRPGDWVEIDGAYGEVKALEARSLRMVTLDDNFVTIPHKKIWDTVVYNANNAKRELMCIADFYLHPKHDAALVRQKLHEVALTSAYLQLDLPISIVVKEKPWGTHYQLRGYPVEGRDQMLFVTDMTIRGKAALAEMGVDPAMVSPEYLMEETDGSNKLPQKKSRDNSRA